MKLILTRHGETEENRRGVIAGWRPGKLSAKGRKQVERIAEHLRGTRIDYILCSDLKRCRDTVAVINRHHHAPVRFLKSLRELSSGIFDGKPSADVRGALAAYEGERGAFKPKGGESMIAFRRRVLVFRKSLARQKKRYDGRLVLIVSHSTWIRTFMKFREPKLPTTYLDPSK